MATSSDLDIASVQFQYKRTEDTTWTNLGSAVTASPYATWLDPANVGWTYANYQLRAVASDGAGKTDANPSSISVTYKNITSPAAITGINAVTDGSTVNLSWTANTDWDLAGYNVYRALNGVRAKVNSSTLDIQSVTYQDAGLADGTYTYDITAVDTAGNESAASSSVSAKVYAPVLVQPDTLTENSKTQLSGNNAEPNSTVELFVDSGSGFVSQQSTVSDGQGNFAFEANLVSGENRFSARVKDSAGNLSRYSEAITVHYNTPPAVPTGLAATVENYDLHLTWNQNAESDVIGYNVYKNGEKINQQTAISPTTVTASSTGNSSSYAPGNILDGDRYTYWSPETNADWSFKAGWCEMDLASPGYISRISIYWSNNGRIGKDYEIQAWSGAEWTTLQKVTGNTETDNVLSVVPLFKTDKIRISVSASTDPYLVEIGEVKIYTGNPIISTEYLDSGIREGQYEYRITAVDTYNVESGPSTAATAQVGTLSPPAAPEGLSAAANGSNVDLNWMANGEADLAGYYVYRDGAKLNGSVQITSGTASASSSLSSQYYAASNAFDLNESTYWYSAYRFDLVDPAWLEIDLPAAEFINHVEINWASAPKDYRLQVWSGTDWVSAVTVTENTESTGIFDVRPSYRTDKIRVYVTETVDKGYVGISEILLFRDNLMTGTMYQDLNVQNGTYTYSVTALDTTGLESEQATAKATVNAAVPQAPVLLNPTQTPENALSIGWEYSGTAAGFNLYRSETTGGPYSKLNKSLIAGSPYDDGNVENEVVYYYVVTAVDSLGNEGELSNEVSGKVVKTKVREQPRIYYPTTSSVPITVNSAQVDIMGSAEPGAAVELFKDGISLGQITASETEQIQQYGVPTNSWSYDLSPDQKTLTYSSGGSVWLLSLDEGATTQIILSGYYSHWSPDGSKLTYRYFDQPTSGTRIGIYDVKSGSATSLTGDITRYAYEGEPDWSPEGTEIVYIYQDTSAHSVMVKDLISGTTTTLVSRGTDVSVYTPKFSPDGKNLAYFEDEKIYILDLATGSTLLVEDNSDWWTLQWSHDGKGLAFISYSGGNPNGDIYTYALDTQSRYQVTSLTDYYVYFPCWSADNRSIFFDRWDHANRSDSLGMAPAYGEGETKYVQDNLFMYYLASFKNGSVVYQNSSTLNIMRLAGHFEFKSVSLNAGENRFYVETVDSAGNTAEQSEEVIVTNESAQPDLSVSPDDAYLYPTYPVAGDKVAVNVIVRNTGSAEAKNVDLLVYQSSSNGNVVLLKSEQLASLGANESEIVSATWDSTGSLGENKLVVTIDPQDTIAETDESNNLAIKDFYVSDHEGISMSTALDASEYGANEDVTATVSLWNSGRQTEGVLDASIEDGQGNTVASLPPVNISLPYGNEKTQTFIWNTGTTYAGSYQVRTRFKNSSDILRRIPWHSRSHPRSRFLRW